MTVSELKEKFTHAELFAQDVDFDFRKRVFTSLFDNLYDNKIVIYDKLTCIASIKDVEINKDYFSVFITPLHLFLTGTPSDKRKIRAFEILSKSGGWTAGCRWEYMRFSDTSLCTPPDGGWFIWTDPILVETVEKLWFANEHQEALGLTIYKAI